MSFSFSIRPTANGWIITEQTSAYLDHNDVVNCYSFNSQEEMLKYIRKLTNRNTPKGSLADEIANRELHKEAAKCTSG